MLHENVEKVRITRAKAFLFPLTLLPRLMFTSKSAWRKHMSRYLCALQITSMLGSETKSTTPVRTFVWSNHVVVWCELWQHWIILAIVLNTQSTLLWIAMIQENSLISLGAGRQCQRRCRAWERSSKINYLISIFFFNCLELKYLKSDSRRCCLWFVHCASHAASQDALAIVRDWAAKQIPELLADSDLQDFSIDWNLSPKCNCPIGSLAIERSGVAGCVVSILLSIVGHQIWKTLYASPFALEPQLTTGTHCSPRIQRGAFAKLAQKVQTCQQNLILTGQF